MKPAGSEVDLGDVVTASAAKQIAENIRTAILQGKLKIDVRLPSEEELAAGKQSVADESK